MGISFFFSQLKSAGKKGERDREINEIFGDWLIDHQPMAAPVQEDEVVAGFLEHGSVEAFGRGLVGRLASAAAVANELPEGDDFMFPIWPRKKLFNHELPRNPPRVDDPTDPEDVTDRFEAVVDSTDLLLEKVVRWPAAPRPRPLPLHQSFPSRRHDEKIE